MSFSKCYINPSPKRINIGSPVQAKRSSGWKGAIHSVELRRSSTPDGVVGWWNCLFTPSCACGLHGATDIRRLWRHGNSIIRIIYSFVLISFLGWLCPSTAVAERARILTPDNGLSNSHITQIYQDSKGYIWIATENGLNKFDGYSFTVYSEQKNDSTSLKGNFVYSILEDSRGIFWVGTMSGLFQYDRNTDSFHPFRIESETPFYLDRVTWILEDKKGNIWLSYPGNGIICLDANTLKPTFYNSDNSKIADNNINYAYEDAFGKLWLGTYGNGLYVLDTNTQSVNHYFNGLSDPSRLNSNMIFSICEDMQGRLLVGTMGGGVNVFDRATQTFKQVMKGNSQTENLIYSICIDKTGNYWLGTDGAGVIR